MRLICKKRFRFVNPETLEEVVAVPDLFQSYPDWISKTRIFKLGLEEGSILEVDKQPAATPIQAKTAPKNK